VQRRWFGVFLLLVILVGIASRTGSVQALLPPFLKKQLGDVLYAVAAYLVLGLFRRKADPWKLALAAFLFCSAVEFFKLCQLPAIQAFRHTRLGGLTLGNGFLWTDFVCYAVGVGACLGVELVLRGREETRSSTQ
jgi:uncharacterized protein DUF2809